MAVFGTLSPADIDFFVRIDEMDRQIKLGGTAELAFVPVSNNSDGSFFNALNTVLKGGNGYDGI